MMALKDCPSLIGQGGYGEQAGEPQVARPSNVNSVCGAALLLFHNKKDLDKVPGSNSSNEAEDLRPTAREGCWVAITRRLLESVAAKRVLGLLAEMLDLTHRIGLVEQSTLEQLKDVAADIAVDP